MTLMLIYYKFDFFSEFRSISQNSQATTTRRMKRMSAKKIAEK